MQIWHQTKEYTKAYIIWTTNGRNIHKIIQVNEYTIIQIKQIGLR